MSPDEDLIITVDSLDEPFDTTQQNQPKRPAQDGGPVRIKVPWNEQGRTARDVARRGTMVTGGPTDDAVADLRGQLTAAQQRAADAERRANEAARAAEGAHSQVERARTVIADTTVSALDSEIASATTESASLKSALKAALDAGEFEKATDLQEKIADVRAKLYSAKERKARVEEEGAVTRMHEGAVRQPQREQARAAPATPEERRQAILANCTPQTRAWLENHPDCIDDPVRAAEASVVHEKAIRAGHRPDTPEYFRYAEEQLGYTTVSKTTRQPQRETPSRQNGSRVESAPVDRGGGGGDGGDGGHRVELTRGELENATNGTIVWNIGPNKGQPIGAKEFARRKLIMLQEGRYNSPAVS